jgi:hypothetical protein
MMRRPYLCAPSVAASALPERRRGSAIPILDKIADKVMQKYQQSTCEQLWQKKSAKTPPSAEEQKVIRNS